MIDVVDGVTACNLESGSVANSEPRWDVPRTVDIQINEECPQVLSSSLV